MIRNHYSPTPTRTLAFLFLLWVNALGLSPYGGVNLMFSVFSLCSSGNNRNLNRIIADNIVKVGLQDTIIDYIWFCCVSHFTT